MGRTCNPIRSYPIRCDAMRCDAMRCDAMQAEWSIRIAQLQHGGSWAMAVPQPPPGADHVVVTGAQCLEINPSRSCSICVSAHSQLRHANYRPTAIRLWGSTPFVHTSCECGGVSAVTGLMPGVKYTFKIMACALDRPLGGWSMPTAWLRCRRRAVTSPSARALAPELPSFSAMFGEKSEHCIDEAKQRQARPS